MVVVEGRRLLGGAEGRGGLRHSWGLYDVSQFTPLVSSSFKAPLAFCFLFAAPSALSLCAHFLGMAWECSLVAP